MAPSILAVADSDSYLKLATSLLHRLGSGWDRRIVLVRTPTTPTEEQVQAAFVGTDLDAADVEILTLNQLSATAIPEDVLFASATGPVVAEIYARVLRSEPADARRTGLISALPGVAFPATTKGWNYRIAGDGFICHSHAEARDFADLSDALTGHQPTILVGKLPFLSSAGFPTPCEQPIKQVVFAPQAKVPFEREQREQILLTLESVARLNPGTEVIVKLRARAGEPQTHLEQFPFDSLLEQMKASGKFNKSTHIRFATGSMQDYLRPGSALVTVSSTAALEAIDHGLPTMVLTDFGVSNELINTVFLGSGIQGSLQDLLDLNFSAPHRTWLRENYFHRSNRDLADSLELLAHRAHHAELRTDTQLLAEIRNFPLRQRVRTSLPSPLLRLARKLRRYLVDA
ncbi:DUF6716 putative glycosyltransferase [Glutamicibacter uratoxydans]|uniref:DUF6716 putative glycosyltransferase n=1 Tax=Glutamicibacter uratoxydans TaxID=43667 RepID=UPI003D6DD0F7